MIRIVGDLGNEKLNKTTGDNSIALIKRDLSWDRGILRLAELYNAVAEQ